MDLFQILLLLLLLFSRLECPTLCNPHGLQHARLPWPSPSLRVCRSSRPLHWWCHPTISSSDYLFSFCLHSFPASRSFPVSFLFASGDQNIGVSATASVLPMSIQGWFPLRFTGWISAIHGTLKSLHQHHSMKASVIQCSSFFMVQLLKPYVTTRKTIALIILNIHWKDWCWSWNSNILANDAKNWILGKDLDPVQDWRQEEKETTEDEMVGWHHRLSGHELEQAPGVGDRQGSLVCCSPWGCKESDMTKQLN